MATILQNTPKPPVFPLCKPVFPQRAAHPRWCKCFPAITHWATILDVDLLGIGDAWLALPPDTWKTEEDCMKAIVANLAVVNDAAERGVKDIRNFGNAARDGALGGCIVLYLFQIGIE